MTRFVVAASAAFLFLTAVVTAQPPTPTLTQTVNDFAKVIDEPSRQELDRRIQSLYKTTGDVVVVATVPTFQPYADIREYAVKMFENNGKGIGEKGKDNGLLVVVAVEDRKVGIEVGYGLEGFITDGFAGQTIREAILPAFRQGQYGNGLVAGTTRLINRIAEQRGVQLQDVPRDVQVERPGPNVGFGSALKAFLFILFLLFIISRNSRRRRRRTSPGRRRHRPRRRRAPRPPRRRTAAPTIRAPNPPKARRPRRRPAPSRPWPRIWPSPATSRSSGPPRPSRRTASGSPSRRDRPMAREDRTSTCGASAMSRRAG